MADLALDQGSSIAIRYDRQKLFILSVIALVTAGMTFSLRATILPDLSKAFFEGTDPLQSATLVAGAAAVAFLSFAIAIFVASPLCDFLGMGRLLALSGTLFVVGATITLAAGTLSKYAPIYWVLWTGFLLVGIAHGLVEATINPLIATLFPEDKTHRLNVLHAWWPGGIIIGSLIGLIPGHHWQLQYGMILVPAVLFTLMLVGTHFPPTERVAAKVPVSDMIKEVFNPLFLILMLAMLLTASSELAPGQWVNVALTLVGMPGIVVLVYVSALMFVMRHFAGTLAHKVSPIGLMWISSLLAVIGLVLLTKANSPITALLAATVWGTGVCYMWPTMLGITSERFPRGGAFLMGVMGSAGSVAIFFILPKLGDVYDKAKVAEATKMGLDFTKLSAQANVDKGAEATLHQILGHAGAASFQFVAMLCSALLIVFGGLWLYFKAQGGYKAVRLDTGAAAPGMPEAAPTADL